MQEPETDHDWQQLNMPSAALLLLLFACNSDVKVVGRNAMSTKYGKDMFPIILHRSSTAKNFATASKDRGDIPLAALSIFMARNRKFRYRFGCGFGYERDLIWNL